MYTFDAERYKKKCDLLVQWMELKQAGICLSTFFEDMKINSIAIYGMGELGRLLYKELQGSLVNVCYGLDRKSIADVEGLTIYIPARGLSKIDAIVITPVLSLNEIEDYIFDTMGEVSTFAIEEVLYELGRKYRMHWV